ncbi:Non-catalytic module family DOC2 [Piromyces sp. E2]|nr:Non-catalytic module family DOC2 [Piromyces sp. E2]|eukprot:OUM59654.1 Non-catalytic module family DOC2 [Piromyces sp. E2]
MLFSKSIVLSFALVGCFVSNSLAELQYTLHKSANPTSDELDAYSRITQAMDKALYYYNTYGNLSKFINVYYNPGVPTAEASNNGDLRFGKDRNYMYEGTAMHEIAHTLGMGTTSEYRAMFQNGVFQGQKAQAVLREIDGPNAVLKGDNQHFWPYGINYRSEVRSEQDLISHVRIVNAMYQDIFKEAFYKEGRIKSVSSGKCMGITSSNTLQLMDCSSKETLVKIYSLGDNPVSYRIELGSRVVDIPNESTAAGIKASTYGYNGGAHQKYLFENSQNGIVLRNLKSNHCLQAVGNDIVQNPYSYNNNSFVWQIVEKTDNASNVNPPSTNVKECAFTALGYPCCSSNNTDVVYQDETGDWGVENNNWCGIRIAKVNAFNCWSKNLGYPCCSTCQNAVYTDNDGKWGIENNNWCGILPSC